MIFIRTNIIWSIISCLLISGILLLIIVLNNPKFIDSFDGLFIFFIFIPLLLGALWGVLQAILTALLKRIFHVSISEEGIQLITISLLPAVVFSLFLILWLLSSFLLESKRRALFYSLFIILFIMVATGLFMFLKKIFSKIINNRKYLWLSVLFISLCLIIAVVSCSPILLSPKGTDSRSKILILGFDGASWNVINPLIKKGEMPNLEKLMKSGSYGNLKSAHPMISPIIWNTIASGKSYKKHGVLSFSYPSYSVKCSRIWDILEEGGSSIGLCGYFQTWPPWKTNGFIIPEHLAPGPETFPPRLSFSRELYLTIKNRELSLSKGIKYGILAIANGIRLRTIKSICLNILDNRFSMHEYFFLADHHKKRIIILQIYGDIFSHLIRKTLPDLSVFYSKLPDNVSHLYWKFMEPEKFDNVKKEEVAKYSEVISNCYKEIDRSIGQILENVDDQTMVFVVSDHGFKALDRYAHAADRITIYYISSEKLLKLLDIYHKAEALHQGKKAFIKIYHEYIDETDNIIELLNSITVKDTGDKIFRVAKLTPGFIQIFVDNNTKNLSSKLIEIKGSYVKFSEIADEAYVTEKSGMHAINGVIVVKGPNIKQNYQINEATIFDITPTILYLLRLPLGKDMDGEVIKEAIIQDFLKEHPVKYIFTYDSAKYKREYRDIKLSEELRKQLKTLGYIR